MASFTERRNVRAERSQRKDRLEQALADAHTSWSNVLLLDAEKSREGVLLQEERLVNERDCSSECAGRKAIRRE